MVKSRSVESAEAWGVESLRRKFTGHEIEVIKATATYADHDGGSIVADSPEYAVGDRVTVHDMLAVSEGAKGTIDSMEYPLVKISVCVKLDEPTAFGREYVIIERKNLRPLSE